MLPPALQMGFVQSLLAQKRTERFIAEALGFQHGFELFFRGPVFGSTGIHGVHRDASIVI